MDTLETYIYCTVPFDPFKHKSSLIFYYLGTIVRKTKIGDKKELWKLKVQFSKPLPRIFQYKDEAKYFEALQEWVDSQCDHFDIARITINNQLGLYQFKSNEMLGALAPRKEEIEMMENNGHLAMWKIGESIVWV